MKAEWRQCKSLSKTRGRSFEDLSFDIQSESEQYVRMFLGAEVDPFLGTEGEGFREQESLKHKKKTGFIIDDTYKKSSITPHK